MIKQQTELSWYSDHAEFVQHKFGHTWNTVLQHGLHIAYDTIEDFNVNSKAEYSALSCTRSTQSLSTGSI